MVFIFTLKPIEVFGHPVLNGCMLELGVVDHDDDIVLHVNAQHHYYIRLLGTLNQQKITPFSFNPTRIHHFSRPPFPPLNIKQDSINLYHG